MPIEQELKDSYLTYAMSVIVSRALPDVRDGLKPSQRRILVAMNDLNLGPGASRVKCAKISGDASGNYHPHGESIVYPTLVRMAQDWNMRHVLIDKQGNFGSVAGLPPAAMRYTEARLSAIAALMLDDLKFDTVDFVPTYDEKRMEPTVLPCKFPNLLVNGASGIAVSMATSIPPHHLGEVCDAVILLLENPLVSIDEILEVLPGPDFPTGAQICGRMGIRQAYYTGRSTIVVRAKCEIVETKKGRSQIVVSEIPYQQTRDMVVERIAGLVKGDKIKGISAIRDLSDLEEPVKLLIDIKNDADPEIVLNQLYQFSPLQTSFSMIFLALVDGKPRELSIKQLLAEFIRHRIQVIRRRTEFMKTRARRRKHILEGLLVALANIDEIIRLIRTSKTQADAKQGLMQLQCPSAMLQRAIGEDAFRQIQQDRGAADSYGLTALQADAILKMTLGQLVNLEQERLSQEHAQLMTEIAEYLRILSDEENIRKIIKDDLLEVKRKHSDRRRTEITGEEIGNIDVEDLITEENMVVSISHRGYIKRTPVSTYRAQRRGGKGLKGAQADEEDPIEHVFAASTHDYLLFFTNRGRMQWQKVYGLPQLSRESRGRAIINLLKLEEGEKIAECVAVRDFSQVGHYLMMATKKGLVKKTALSKFSRPRAGGIIAIKLREDDELIDVSVSKTADDILLATANGMAIRFDESDVRPTGRNTSGVKGITLRKDDFLVGMVVVDPEATLLTACENGFGKRTTFGPKTVTPEDTALPDDAMSPDDAAIPEELDESVEAEEEDVSSSTRYRTQRRGGKGVRDIKTTERNGRVIGILPVQNEDEILLMTSRGKIQRINCADVKSIGRNTQGVNIMSMDEGDSLAAVVRVPRDENVVETDLVSTTPRLDRPSTGSSAIAPAFDEEDEIDDVESNDESDE